MRTEEQHVRALLDLAAEPPDEVSPPIARLIRNGHQQRARRTVLSVVATAVVVAAAAVAPSLTAGTRLSTSGTNGSSATASGPTSAQLASYHWAKLAPSPLGRSDGSIVALAGRELLEIGSQRPNHYSAASAAYDPASDHWRPIAPEPLFIDPGSALTMWTGHQLVIAGHYSSCLDAPTATCVPLVEIYDPVANRWSTAQPPESLGQRGQLLPLAAAWTGSQVVVAGSRPNGKLGVVTYNPASGRWRDVTPPLAAGHPLWTAAGIVAAGHRLILWSSWTHPYTNAGVPHNRFGVNVFARSETGIWSDLTSSWPHSQFVAGPIRTRSAILVPPVRNDLVSDGLFLNPRTLAVTAIPPSPFAKDLPAFSWTGREVIAVDVTSSSNKFRPGDTAAFNPATRLWHALPTAPVSTAARQGLLAAPVWTGSELLALTQTGGLLAFRH